MTLKLNDVAPNFVAETTEGKIDFHEWIDGHWAVLFSHPKDFTPVCTTELGCLAGMHEEFSRRDCKIMGLSIDSVADHRRWLNDIAEVTGNSVDYPLIGDVDLKVAKLYGMLPASEEEPATDRTAADNATVRSVFVVGPDKRIRLSISYPMTTGRNFDEILRVIDSMQLTAQFCVATPAQWKRNEDVIVIPSIPDNIARQTFGEMNAKTPYLRYVKSPAA